MQEPSRPGPCSLAPQPVSCLPAAQGSWPARRAGQAAQPPLAELQAASNRLVHAMGSSLPRGAAAGTCWGVGQQRWHGERRWELQVGM